MSRLPVTLDESWQRETAHAAALAAALWLLSPVLHGQCMPLADAAKVAASGAQPMTATPDSSQPQFYDEPQFTVAGVTDPSNLGGHGSDTIVRTKDVLARDAAELGKDAPATVPANAGYRSAYEQARAYADAGQYRQARSSLRRQLDEDRPRLSVRDQAVLHHLLAGVEEKLGNPVEAVGEYQRAAELDPNERHLFDWGTELLLHHAPEPAAEVFAKGNRLFPHSVRMLTGLGSAWYGRGSYEQAAGSLCQASDLNPDDPAPYIFLGKILAAGTVQPEGLTERLERFARLQPENAQANYYYALSLWKHRKSPEDVKSSEQVESLLEKAVRLDTKLAAAYLQLGVLYAERNDFPRAIAAYEKAGQADAALPEPHYRLAQVYKRLGDTKKSRSELQLYEQTSKKAVEENERQRRELPQFVVTSRDRTVPAPPQ